MSTTPRRDQTAAAQFQTRPGREVLTRQGLLDNLVVHRAQGARHFPREVQQQDAEFQGGVLVDENARVLDQNARPLPNLFASGGAACGVSGSEDWGYLSGNGLFTAVALGKIAGRSAAGN